MYTDAKTTGWMAFKHFVVVLVIGAMSIALFSAARKQLFPEAQAQEAPSLQERQVQALETIASEMSRMRRGKCR